MTTLDITEAAALLKVDEETARRLAPSGDIYAAKIGRSWVFLRDDLIDYIRKATRDQTARRRLPPEEQRQQGRSFKAPPALP